MRTCILCRCTEDLACAYGCSWARLIGKDRGVCSSCPTPLPTRALTVKQRAARKELADKVRRIDVHRRSQLNNAISAQRGYEDAVDEARAYERKLARAAA